MALSGGSTPRALHECLSGPPFAAAIPWTQARYFFSDERCVPPGNARSNYRMAKESLFDPLAVPPVQVFRMRGEEEPRKAAEEYRQVIEREFRGEPRPRFDLVLLGMGADGHTASLFPGTRALAERRGSVVANYVPKLREWRLTMTYPVFDAARRVVFLVSGKEKSAPAGRILARRRGCRELPAARVRPKRGALLWLLDEDAASEL